MDLSQFARLIVFGGSFDPPHVGHVQLPALAMEAVGADVVVYVPAARQPLKLDEEQAPPLHRLTMLQLALSDVPHAFVLTDELDRAGDGQPSYTVNTLRNLRHRLAPNAQMRLLIGSDQLRLFDQWRCADRIVEMAEPIVMVRPPDSRGSLLADLPEGFDPRVWARRLIPVPLVDVSSTAIRQRMSQGMTIDGLVDPRVQRYIAERGLYGAKK